MASGPKADQICAFARTNGKAALVMVASRFPARLRAEPEWGETSVAAPRAVDPAIRWRDLLTGQVIQWRAGEALPVQELPHALPVVVLVPDREVTLNAIPRPEDPGTRIVGAWVD